MTMSKLESRSAEMKKLAIILGSTLMQTNSSIVSARVGNNNRRSRGHRGPLPASSTDLEEAGPMVEPPLRWFFVSRSHHVPPLFLALCFRRCRADPYRLRSGAGAILSAGALAHP